MCEALNTSLAHPNLPLNSHDSRYVAEGQKIQMYACHGFRGKQEWIYDPATKMVGVETRLTSGWL